MNKTELVKTIASKTELSNKKSEEVLNTIIEIISKTLKKGESVQLIGFGNFGVKKRAARTGVNPKTGAKLKISARKVPHFKAGSKLKDMVK